MLLFSAVRFSDVTFEGPPPSDMAELARLPDDYKAVLVETNGVIAFHGGLHLRGIGEAPAWHMLSEVWQGAHALHRLFPAVNPNDIPFGQDCLGDQFILRDGAVWRLSAESGELEPLELGIAAFLQFAVDDPIGFLHLQPLVQFQLEGGKLEPGQLLSVYPPFITVESANGVHLEAVPALERLSFLANFARQIADMPDGSSFKLRPVD